MNPQNKYIQETRQSYLNILFGIQNLVNAKEIPPSFFWLYKETTKRYQVPTDMNPLISLNLKCSLMLLYFKHLRQILKAIESRILKKNKQTNIF